MRKGSIRIFLIFSAAILLATSFAGGRVNAGFKKNSVKKRMPSGVAINFKLPPFFRGIFLGDNSSEIVFQNKNDSIDSILIWYGFAGIPDFSDSAHTRRIDPGFFYSESDSDTLKVTIRDSILSSGKGMVYAGLVLVKGSHYSDTLIAVINHSPTETVSFSGNGVAQTVFQNVTFDSSSQKLKIVHKATNPQISTDTIQLISKAVQGKSQVFTFHRASDSIELDLREFEAGQQYQISLRIRDVFGNWGKPSESGRFLFQMPKLPIYSFSFDTLKRIDTIRAFNGGLMIYNRTSSIRGRLSGKARKAPLPDSLGGKVLSGAYGLELPPVSDSYRIGLKIDSLGSAGGARVYRLEDEKLYLEPVYKLDKKASIIWFRTDKGCGTFISLIDSLRPQIEVLSDTSAVVVPGSNIFDSVVVKDNISLIKWIYLLSKEVPYLIPVDSGFINTSDTLFLRVPEENFIREDIGLRAFLVLDDGAGKDTFNLSRRVVRSESNETLIDAKSWTPLRVTSFLHDPEIKDALKYLSDGDTFNYDPRLFRVYRWYNQPGTFDEGGWLEYTPVQKKLFTMKPGSVLWVKTRDKISINFGSGITPSLKDTFSLVMQPQSWTDLAVPFQFPVKFSDIFTASSITDSLHLYRWTKDTLSFAYFPDPLFLPSLYGSIDAAICDDSNVYRIYNPASKKITLRIPPTPAFINTTPSTVIDSSKALFRVVSRNAKNEIIGVNFFAVSDKDILLPRPVSMSRIKTGFLSSDRLISGGHITHKRSDTDGHIFELFFDNISENNDTVNYTVQNINNISSLKIAAYNPEKGKPDRGPIILNSGKTVNRPIIVGPESFHNRYQDEHFPSRPRIIGLTFKNDSVHFSFSLPTRGAARVVLSVIDYQGNTVWHRSMLDIQGGKNVVKWDGLSDKFSLAPAGFYIFRITVFLEASKESLVEYRQFWYLPSKSDLNS